MKQLTPTDAGFLLAEHPHSPSNGTTIWIYDRSTRPGGHLGFGELLAHVGARVPLIPPFHKRLQRVPGGLDRPWWVDDAHFDLEYHVRHIALPPPGDWHQFWVQVARLHARPLDLTRPLWELYMIEGIDGLEGVPGGAFALVLKVHHAAADGQTAMLISELMHTDALHAHSGASPPRAEPEPTSWELLARAMFNGALLPLRAAQIATRATPSVPSALRSLTNIRPALAAAPETRFGGTVSAHRVLDGVFVDLDDLKRIRKGVEGATINDVALAVFGGALRNYLSGIGELPQTPLRAMTPVALKSPPGAGIGNNVSAHIITLATDVGDPLDRLATITAASSAAKATSTALGTADLGAALALIPQVVLEPGARWGRALTRRGLAAAFNTVVSNVAGSPEPLTLAGAQMIHLAGAAPLSDGLGLMNYLLSYAGEAMFGFTACREMMPDPERYADAIRAAIAELGSAT